MSLMPSESYSFPDHFSRTISRARTVKDVRSVAPPVKPQPRRAVERVVPSAAALPARIEHGRPQKLKGVMRVTPAVYADVPRAREVEQKAAPGLDFESRPKGRRRHGWLRFMVVELSAIAMLVPAAMLALSHYFADPALVLMLNIVTIIAAVFVVVMPIIFFALAPTLPHGE